jgi:hypothetical protein
MIEAARSEGEMAGVIAHEISHVALRHGTAQQATRTQSPGIQLGALGGAILGTVIGGNAGDILAQGTQLASHACFFGGMAAGRGEERRCIARSVSPANAFPRTLPNADRRLTIQQGRSRSAFALIVDRRRTHAVASVTRDLI